WRTSMFAAQLYTNMKRYGEAIDQTRKAIELNPRFVQGRLNLALLLRRAGRVQEAIQTYTELIEERPNYGQAYQGLAELYAQNQDYQQAVDVLRGWLNRNPSDAGAQKRLKQYEQILSGPATAPADTSPGPN
ncbi:MAG: tetratricopeptide repeat protein, partial [bacterium]